MLDAAGGPKRQRLSLSRPMPDGDAEADIGLHRTNRVVGWTMHCLHDQAVGSLPPACDAAPFTTVAQWSSFSHAPPNNTSHSTRPRATVFGPLQHSFLCQFLLPVLWSRAVAVPSLEFRTVAQRSSAFWVSHAPTPDQQRAARAPQPPAKATLDSSARSLARMCPPQATTTELPVFPLE